MKTGVGSMGGEGEHGNQAQPLATSLKGDPELPHLPSCLPHHHSLSAVALSPRKE